MQVENGNFETGTFSNWRTIGNNSIETSELGINPSEGTYQALISNGAGRSGNAVNDKNLESFLGLTPGILDNLGNGDVIEGSAIKRTFTLEAGDVLTFDWNFLTNEEISPDSDFAFFSLTSLTTKLADVDSPLLVETFTEDFSSETGYQTTSIAVSESDTYTLSFGVVDVGDDGVDSALLVDDVQISFDDGGGIEPNDTISDAIDTELLGEGFYSISTEIGDNFNLLPEDDVDLFELQLNAGERLIADIDASILDSSLDSVLRLFDSEGNQVAVNDDSEGDLDSFIDFTAEFSDTYYVGVSSFANFDYDPLTEGSGTGSSFGFYDLYLTVEEGNNSDSEFDIDINFLDGNLTPAQQAVFDDAANRWSEIIIGDLPDVIFDDLGLVDDLVIDASAPFIDGSGGILGQAGPTIVRTDSFLPARGIMEFDIADVEDLETEGLLDEVILHEMGHVLGVGTIWELLDLLTDTESNDPRFVGTGATEEYNAIFGVDEFGVPVEADGGPGTALGHWDEEVFDNELMTGFINFGDNPLSRITAASISDLGYEVDIDAADVYVPPSAEQSIAKSIVGQIPMMENIELQFVDPLPGYDGVSDSEMIFA